MTEINAKNLNLGNHVKHVGDMVVNYGCASKELSQLFSEIESTMCQAKLSVGERRSRSISCDYKGRSITKATTTKIYDENGL